MSFGVALIGLDHWYTAFGFIDNTKAAANATLIGIAESDAARRAFIAEKHPDVAVAAEPDALIGDPRVELVAICATTARAPDLAKRALAAGKHVLSVKPPARTLAELDAVLAVAAESGRFYGSFEGIQRLNPRAVLLRELIAGGAIGTPLSFHHVAFGGLPSPWPGQSGPSWWLDADSVPGGGWIDHAIYSIDLARFIFGGEITQASGLIGNRVHENLKPLEDYGAALLQLDAPTGPVTLFLEDTWIGAASGASRTQFIGTDGSIRPDGSDWVVTKSGVEARHAIPASPFFAIDALAALLQSNRTPPFGPADARANLAACLAVYEAAR